MTTDSRVTAHPNEIPNYSLSPAELDRGLEQGASDALRRKKKAEADQMWPVAVADALRLLSGKVELLTARVAVLEGAPS